MWHVTRPGALQHAHQAQRKALTTCLSHRGTVGTVFCSLQLADFENACQAEKPYNIVTPQYSNIVHSAPELLRDNFLTKVALADPGQNPPLFLPPGTGYIESMQRAVAFACCASASRSR